MRLVPLAAAAAGLVLAAAAPPAAPRPQDVRITSTATPLNPSDPTTDRAGELRFAWGAVLRVRGSSRFGGLSGLEAEPVRGGYRFTAVTDEGDVVHWTSDGEGPPAGPATLRPLLDPAGKVPTGKRQRDAEDVARTDGGYLVAFEGAHRIQRYAGDGGGAFARAAEPAPAPVTDGLSENLGFEAVAVLPDGTVAVGAEGGRLWLCAPAGDRCDVALRGPPEFAWWLTALDTLPGTPDLIGLYRFYNPFTREFAAMIAYLPVRDGRVRVVPLSRLAAPLTVGNFEGVAAVRRGDGFRLFVVSDNGFAEGAPTRLMAFDWTAPNEKGPASPPAPDQKS